MEFDLTKIQKKGQASLSNKMTGLVGALIVIVLAVSLAPTMFEGVAGLEAELSTPDWVPTVLFVIIGAGIVFLIWRAFNN